MTGKPFEINPASLHGSHVHADRGDGLCSHCGIGVSGDGLRDELTSAFRASDLAGGGIDYPTLVAAVLPVVQAHIAAAREQVAEQIAQAIEARDALAAQLERYDGQAWDDLYADRDAAVARAETAEQALQRVRELADAAGDRTVTVEAIRRALDGAP